MRLDSEVVKKVLKLCSKITIDLSVTHLQLYVESLRKYKNSGNKIKTINL